MKDYDFRKLDRWKDTDFDGFYAMLDRGEDINLFIGDALFWLGAWHNGTRIISQCPDGRTEGIYKDADDMLDHFVFKGKTLREHFPDIEFTSC